LELRVDRSVASQLIQSPKAGNQRAFGGAILNEKLGRTRLQPKDTRVARKQSSIAIVSSSKRPTEAVLLRNAESDIAIFSDRSTLVHFEAWWAQAENEPMAILPAPSSATKKSTSFRRRVVSTHDEKLWISNTPRGI